MALSNYHQCEVAIKPASMETVNLFLLSSSLVPNCFQILYINRYFPIALVQYENPQCNIR